MTLPAIHYRSVTGGHHRQSSKSLKLMSHSLGYDDLTHPEAASAKAAVDRFPIVGL